jgi:tetratricopeptide (TPR) repeat protein
MDGSSSGGQSAGEALAAAGAEVKRFRILAAAQPETYRPSLANALDRLSNELWRLGRREEAVPVLEEAVQICRELAAARPAFRPGLAIALYRLAGRLLLLRRHAEALLANDEAVKIYREVAAANPDLFRTGLLSALSEREQILIGLGRLEESMTVSQEVMRLLVAAPGH